MTVSDASIIDARRSGAIPSLFNISLGCAYTVINFYQLYLLPLLLLPHGGVWALTLVPVIFLSNPFWSLIHEAIHDLFHANRKVNGLCGRWLALWFGAPFRIVRMSHLLHHKLNRLPIEGTEYYDGAKTSRAGAAAGYYFQIFIGLYLAEILSAIYFLLPRSVLQRIKNRFVGAKSVSALLMDNWLRDEALHEIRVDGLLTLGMLSLAFFCYGPKWWVLALALLGRGFLISFLDNIYHYETPVSDVFYAKNLRLPAVFAKPLLNFNLHGIHHVNPAIPWIHLPRAFEIQSGSLQGNYFIAALRQLRGPIAIQDLPHATPTARIRVAQLAR